MTADYKQTALSVRDVSSAIGFADFGASIFRTILQSRPSLAQLQAWNQTLLSAQAFIQREVPRAQSEMGASAEWNRKAVLEKALKEGWSRAEFEGLETIAQVATSKNTCERYVAASSLANCAGMNLFGKAKGQLFDPSFGSR